MSKTFRRVVLACVAGFALSSPASAADVAAGRALAQKWCAVCHNIEAGAPFKLRPPSFASIAVFRPPEDIRSKIISPHIGMPDITWTLQAEQIEDIEAYITSLEVK
jgi:mono/diheme cytochrome c family protein